MIYKQFVSLLDKSQKLAPVSKQSFDLLCIFGVKSRIFLRLKFFRKLCVLVSRRALFSSIILVVSGQDLEDLGTRTGNAQ